MKHLLVLKSARYSFRFRETAPFGSTIRRFAHNVSELKKLAARDFEDILIVSASIEP